LLWNDEFGKRAVASPRSRKGRRQCIQAERPWIIASEEWKLPAVDPVVPTKVKKSLEGVRVREMPARESNRRGTRRAERVKPYVAIASVKVENHLVAEGHRIR